MVAPVTARFGKFRVLLDLSGTGTYSAQCGFTSKSFSQSKSLSEVLIPDCDDPHAAIVVGRDVESISFSVSGEGVLAASALPTWQEAFRSTESVAVKVETEFSTGTMTWTGRMHVETFEITGEQGSRLNVSVSMQSDGDLVATDTF